MRSILKLYGKGGTEMKQKTKETLGYIINGLSIVVFFFLASALDVSDVSPLVKYLAWILFGLGIFLVVLSTSTLIRHREEGLLERGIYGIVRHPMYLGAMVLFLSWIFFLPHWVILLISCVNIVIVYWGILQGERQNIEKFGSAYRRYMEDVPRMNLLAGLLRSVQRR
jgi:protein-S-isoprenylcysteine O-methyltransferase Ste14